jgi:peptidoglycan/LPS O-acetylase OafA/YrhL
LTLWGVGWGSVGVTLFFCLSGYLIPTVWLRDQRIGPYLARRGARIVPGYLAACVVLALLTGVPLTLRDLTMTQAFDLTRFDTFMGVAWTLQLEVVFYLLVPLIARLPKPVIVGMGVASLALPSVWFVGAFWRFVPGMLLVGRRLPVVNVPRAVTYGAAISYGIYLWHHEILRWLRDVDGPIVIGGIALTLLAAVLSWHVIERPAIRIHRVHERPDWLPAVVGVPRCV